jgi:hypothetical protein
MVSVQNQDRLHLHAGFFTLNSVMRLIAQVIERTETFNP